MTKWVVDSRPIYYVRCRRCGRQLVEWWGWNPVEAISVALEMGWADGLCEDCLEVQERLQEVVG